MKYNLNKIATKQLKLDKYIKDKINISNDKYWSQRIIALNVELNEFSNEVRFFKYWSNKPASDKKVILHEFVDILHFVLSLSNTLNLENLEFKIEETKREIYLIYLDISKKIIEVHDSKDKKVLKILIYNILEMAWSLGYTMKDIQKAYDKKNKINYDRQNTGY